MYQYAVGLAIAILIQFGLVAVVVSLGAMVSSLVLRICGRPAFFENKIIRFTFEYLFGLRLLWLALYALGWAGLGLQYSIYVVVLISLCWLLYRCFVIKTVSSLQALNLDWSLIAVVAPLLLVTSLVPYIPVANWDHFTYWGLVPFEMLGFDQLVGLYPRSMSCCANYAPQQVTAAAFALSFWVKFSYSDSVLSLFTIWNLGLAMMLLWALLTELRQSRLCKFLVLVLFFLFMCHSGIYFTRFLGDMLVVLTLGFCVLSLCRIDHSSKATEYIWLNAIIVSMPVMLKTYAFVLVPVFLALIAFWNRRLVVVMKITALVAAFFALERLLFTYSLKANTVLSDSVTIDHAVFRGLEPYSRIPFNGVLAAYLILLVIALLLMLKSPNRSGLSQLEKRLPVAGLICVGVLNTTLLALITVLSSVAHGIPRYFSNTNLVLSLVVVAQISVLLPALSSRARKGLVILAILSAVIYTPNTKLFEYSMNWFSKLQSGKAVSFKELDEFKYRFVDKIKSYSRKPGQVLLLHNKTSTYGSNRWVYMLARTNTRLTLLGPIFRRKDPRLERYYQLRAGVEEGSLSLEEMRKNKIRFLLFPSPWVKGKLRLSGLYTPKQYLAALARVRD